MLKFYVLVVLLLTLAAAIGEKPTTTKPTTSPSNSTFKNCVDAVLATGKGGIHSIYVSPLERSIKAVCNEREYGGGWQIIQRRVDGSEEFYRPWVDYKNGFGNLSREFFIGLDILHALTEQYDQELLVLLEDHNLERRYARYDAFVIGDESESYNLKLVGNYTGDAGDSFSQHMGRRFSTFDRDHDTLPTENCAKQNRGAWWYDRCLESNLNGAYLGDMNSYSGITWHEFRGNQSLKTAQMLIRPKGLQVIDGAEL